MSTPEKPPEVVTLTERANKWLEKIPEEARPKLLQDQFPRIVNRISSMWNHPDELMEYLNELLMDTRGDRAGFPLPVAMEIATIKDYYEMNIHPESKAYLWDPRVKKTPGR
jgi:uncharacterized protein